MRTQRHDLFSLFLLATSAACPLRSAAAQDPFDCSGVIPSEGDELRVELVLGNLVKPVDVQSPPGDTSRLFIVEQQGMIKILRLADDTLLAESFLNISAKVDDGGEKGLLGLAFHPDYAANGFFFVNYTRVGATVDLETVVARYEVSAADEEMADPSSELVLLAFEQPFSNHNGGQLAFSPLDGYLYASTGDGGDADDPGNRAQNPGTFLGKMLRLDVDGGAPYAVPPTNPFAGDDGILDEIWALGLRNPWRFAFDPETADLYIADVGQGDWEEVDFQPSTSPGGENYEWKVREGAHTFSGSTSFGPGVRTSPILEYAHAGTPYTGCSITGGVVYRGCTMPDLNGSYFFADYCTDFIRTFRYENGQVKDLKNRTTELNTDLGTDKIDDIGSFGVDGRGEVYICDLRNSRKGDSTAKLFRIVAKNPPVGPRNFVRGDANADDSFDLSDAIYTLGHLFLGNPSTVPCRDALDSNDDGKLDISDAVSSLDSLFSGGPQPPAPHPDCGTDPTEDDTECAASTCD